VNTERLGNDLALMGRVAAGDVAARKAVIRRLMNRVRSVAKALLSDQFDVDDATQIALIEILRSAKAYRGQSLLEAWADRIAIRASMRLVRERNARSARTDTIREPDQLESRPPRSGSLPDMPRQLHEYLDEISDDRRTALVLRHVFEYSVEEIADLTGVSRNTVKDRLLRARQEVRRMIRRELAIGPLRIRKSG
jgi:RNA polymerase sigma-70 factor (ECF subfamily)